jgi:nitrous oxidase accessory protein NosD
VKKLYAILICLFFLTMMYPITVSESSINNIIYVDDDNVGGPWDGTKEYPYQKIQDAINIASEGDVIFVYRGTYAEQLVIDKAVHLLGEDRNTTIIDSKNAEGESPKLVCITSDDVNMSCLTIHQSPTIPKQYCTGISIRNCSNISIFYNLISNCHGGIELLEHSSAIITNNVIQNKEGGCGRAIGIWQSTADIINNSISKNYQIAIIMTLEDPCTATRIIGNTIISNVEGISIDCYNYVDPCTIVIQDNILEDNENGLHFQWLLCSTIDITRNTFHNSEFDINFVFLFFSKVTVTENNFFCRTNRDDCLFANSYRIHWIHNYWERYIQLGPKYIRGLHISFIPHIGPIPVINVDWFPARRPYDIGGGT